LSINCPATPETTNIINKKTLEFFPEGAIITNSARGDMIDDEAMVKALISGRIFALGLDVYKGEPNIHPGYLNQPNVFILPHLGSATKKTRIAMADLAIDNIEEYFKTGHCKNMVN
jgi:glyoxylate reductase